MTKTKTIWFDDLEHAYERSAWHRGVAAKVNGEDYRGEHEGPVGTRARTAYDGAWNQTTTAAWAR